MRHIHLDEGLRLRFPARPSEFDEGVEVGMVAALMTLGQGRFHRRLAPSSLDQVRAVAAKLGYHLVVDSTEDLLVEVEFRRGPERPKLAVVHTSPALNGVAEKLFGAPKRAELRAI